MEVFQKVFIENTKNAFGQIWLFNELVFTFSAPIKYAKAQFNPIILSKVIVSSDGQFRKNRFFYSGDLIKIAKVIFHIKPIPTEKKIYPTKMFLLSQQKILLK